MGLNLYLSACSATVMWCPSGGGFPGHIFVGAILLISGTVIQWAVSIGTGDFLRRCLLGLCAGTGVWGLALIFGQLLH